MLWNPWVTEATYFMKQWIILLLAEKYMGFE